jgi:hypothetical protein
MRDCFFIFFLFFVVTVNAEANEPNAGAKTDSVNITIYVDMRDAIKFDESLPGKDSAYYHNAYQLKSYNPLVMYLTGEWTPPIHPTIHDWSFFTMTLVKPEIFKKSFKYKKGQCRNNVAGWYFSPTNDWKNSEWVSDPCNEYWGIQRCFQIDYTKDTVAVFKYGECQPQTFASIGIPEFNLPSLQSQKSDTFEIPVKAILKPSKEKTLSYNFELSYNPAIVSFLDLKTDGTLSANGVVKTELLKSGQLSVKCNKNLADCTEGTLLLLRFKAKKAGNSDLNISNFELNNEKVKNPISGVVTVK